MIEAMLYTWSRYLTSIMYDLTIDRNLICHCCISSISLSKLFTRYQGFGDMSPGFQSPDKIDIDLNPLFTLTDPIQSGGLGPILFLTGNEQRTIGHETRHYTKSVR